MPDHGDNLEATKKAISGLSLRGIGRTMSENTKAAAEQRKNEARDAIRRGFFTPRKPDEE